MSRSLKKSIGIGLAAAFCLSAAFQAANTEQKVGTEYTDDEGRTHKILGVANISADKVTAWDPSGTVSPELSKRIEEILLTKSQQELSFRFGKKNRYVLIETDRNGPNISWRTDGDEFMQNVYLSMPDTNRLNLFRISRDPQSGSISISATFNSAKLNRAEIPVEVGKKAEVNGYVYEFVNSISTDKPAANRYPGQKFRGKFWKLIFKVEATSPDEKKASMSQFPYYSLGAEGTDGKPIQYVDLKGNPVTGETYLLDPEPEQQYDSSGMAVKAKESKYTYAGTIPGTMAAGAMSVVTNIHPTKIKKLFYTWSTAKTVRFANVPLDPK